MATKNIYVVLTRSNTILSNLIHLFTHDDYTHAALALDQDLEQMFSFGRRHARNPFLGCFKQEHLHRGLYALQRQIPGIILELSVTDQQYRQVQKIVAGFQQNSQQYGYNYWGLLGGLLHTRLGRKNRYLCSQFVYHVLYLCGICDLGKPPELVRPQELLHIKSRVVFRGNLKYYEPRLARPVVMLP